MFERLGGKYSPFTAEIMLSWGYGTIRFEPICQFFTEVFLATQFGFLAVGNNLLSALPAAQREALVEASAPLKPSGSERCAR